MSVRRYFTMKSQNAQFPGLLHETISEEHMLQSFTDGDREEETGPSSPRNRSHSVIVSGCKTLLLPSLSNIGHRMVSLSSDMLSNFDSLPKNHRRSYRHLGRLNTLLLSSVRNCNALEVQKLLDAGADPNATCHTEYISVVHIAALYNYEILSLLLQRGAERQRADRLGRTPLHLAAWAGNVRNIGALLDFLEELQQKMVNGEMTAEIEEEVVNMSDQFKDAVNVKCVLGDLMLNVPEPWRDNLDHNCVEIDLPFLQPGWTPLHAASCSARHHCCRLLLAAGAEPCARDFIGRVPLDVAGSACHYGLHNKQPFGPALLNIGFTEVIRLLLTQSCKKMSFKKNLMLDTPLHTAVELGNSEAIQMLLEAGTSPRSMNRAGLTPLHLCVKKRLKHHLQVFVFCDSGIGPSRVRPSIDLKDKDGYTVLHSAVMQGWLAGVCVALEAGANIVLPAHDGDAPLHTAAALGNLDILKEITNFAKAIKVIDCLNQKGETALFKAVINGHTDCVKLLLKEGASIELCLSRQYNVFHLAAQRGHLNILNVLLDHNYTLTRGMVNYLTIDSRRGYGPIHFAVENNHIECVKLLLSRNAFISLKTTGGIHKGASPLHIAARKNFAEIAKIIIKFDPSTVHNIDALGWTPLHAAGYYASRDVITLLISEGADLSACSHGPMKFRRTAIELITKNLSKPTEFMESIFDTYIHSNKICLQDPEAEVTVDFRILVPDKKHMENTVDKDTSVIEALLKTGNRNGQRRLLIHPLLESFLALKWRALQPFFYATLMLYGLFLATLTIFVMSEYFYRDNVMAKPLGLDTVFWKYALYTTIFIVVLQEFIYITASRKFFLLQFETWVKIASIGLAVILPSIISNTPTPLDGMDLPRHVATMAVLLAWLNMTVLLSRFPQWGYYVLMFGKVSSNVLKILLTFAFLVIGFALSFMIQFHSKTPFESPWAALVKTMVMMTSEFDYDDLVDKKDSKEILQSLVIVRLVFLIFLILAAIVLMNLMVGVAVNDLHNLEVLGQIMRLEKQVEFLSSLETLVLKKVFLQILPATWKYNLEFMSRLTIIVIRPCEPSWSYYKAIPPHVRDAIFEKALKQKKHEDHQTGYERMTQKLCEIHETITKNEEFPSVPAFRKNDAKRLTDTDMIVVRMKREMDEMNAKLDMMVQMLINQTVRRETKELPLTKNSG